MSNVVIRHAQKSDGKNLLELMKKLAVFEDYIDDFVVTVDDLLERGFSAEPEFTAIVAEQNSELGSENENQLKAYLVYYLIPFTYDLKPTLFIKELYVDESQRGEYIGKKLMQQAISDAKEKGCGRMKWDVLSDNIEAQLFYQSFGASYDTCWQGYVLNLENASYKV
jgi:ribosomal protein S18 acetylase RimI-like enzyme